MSISESCMPNNFLVKGKRDPGISNSACRPENRIFVIVN